MIYLRGHTPGNVLSLHLDEPEGSTTFYDTSGYANNATCSGDACPVAGVPGAVGTALNFNRVSDSSKSPIMLPLTRLGPTDKVTNIRVKIIRTSLAIYDNGSIYLAIGIADGSFSFH